MMRFWARWALMRALPTSSAISTDAFHAAGLAHGGSTCENPPGWRDAMTGKLYLSYLRDPDGHKICALHRPAE